MRRLFAFILPWAIAGMAAHAQPRQGLDPTIQRDATIKMTPHVYMIPDQKKPIVPNVGFVVRDKATLVIDTGLGETNGLIVLEEARKLSNTATFYVAATHTHPEHDLGAMAFPDDATIVRSTSQQQDIEEFGMGLAERFAQFSERTAELLQGARIRASDIVFTDTMTIDLGGVHVRLKEAGPAHTRGDLVFFVEEDGVLFTGDVVINEFPMPISPTSSIRRWLVALDELEALDPELIIPSHYSTGSSALIGAYRDFFTTVQARVDGLVSEGMAADEVGAALQEELAGSQSGWSDPGRIQASVRVALRERDQNP